MMTKPLNLYRNLLTLTIVLAGAVGCAITNQSLQHAKSAYEAAANDEKIARYAPVTLHEAKQALNEAQHSDDTKEKDHLASIVETKVKIAQEQSERKSNEDEMQNLHKSRQDILLEGREKETAMAKERARQAEERTKIVEAENQAMEEDLTVLQSELSNLQMKQTDRGLELTLKDVLFDFNKTELNAGGERLLDKLAAFINQSSNRQVLIEGFTDSLGTDNYNEQLSQKRAEVVKDYLIDKGVTPDRLAAKGYGERYPVASNTTEAGRQQNRRVQIIMLKDNQTTTSRK